MKKEIVRMPNHKTDKKKNPVSTMRSSCWVGTINLACFGSLDALDKYEFILDEKVRYIKYAHEIGASKDGQEGNHHIQFALQTFEQVRGAAVLKMLPVGSHLEVMRVKTVDEKLKAFDYPGREEKSGSVVWVRSLGELSFSGASGVSPKQSALQDVKELIDAGCDINTLWQQHFHLMVVHGRGIMTYWGLKNNKEQEQHEKSMREREKMALEHHRALLDEDAHYRENVIMEVESQLALYRQ